jgi:hypothetical protein
MLVFSLDAQNDSVSIVCIISLFLSAFCGLLNGIIRHGPNFAMADFCMERKG